MTRFPIHYNAVLLCILLTMQSIYSSVRAETLTLTTLEWPPFTGEQLAGKGIITQIIRRSLNSQGHELTSQILPWNRAVRMVITGKSTGYYPEYKLESDNYIFSDPIGESPIGIVERKSNPIKWQQVSDLNPYTMGVISGYVNTDEIDLMIKDGRQKFDVANHEKQSILKLAAKRVDLIIIDLNVYQYLKNDPDIAKVIDLLQVNDKVIANKSLHIAFENSPEGDKWNNIVNQGLKQLQVQQIIDAYLDQAK
ncbi:substrate-binding periplasmic protein [Shewanella aestuarii]|uniref:ABC transporter substrate-binding protein n=1 Tax=Shewanella aestuarii TaxID=1028752 RepID=A0A6G9QKL0_9GAMM|nr:ABC transporter substrate-binding protein [Shewanella aestuarii]QIR14409.1 ABC transporter substrate-binding protein [Shewanella aestuarii]